MASPSPNREVGVSQGDLLDNDPLNTEPPERMQARRKALDLLSRREHSRAELETKLAAKGCATEWISGELDALEQRGLLSDARYAEEYLRQRSAKGHGPLRIEQELRQRGVDSGLFERAAEEQDIDWTGIASRVRHKRFGAALPEQPKDRAKQVNFLRYRGFTGEQIRAAMEG